MHFSFETCLKSSVQSTWSRVSFVLSVLVSRVTFGKMELWIVEKWTSRSWKVCGGVSNNSCFAYFCKLRKSHLASAVSLLEAHHRSKIGQILFKYHHIFFPSYIFWMTSWTRLTSLWAHNYKTTSRGKTRNWASFIFPQEHTVLLPNLSHKQRKYVRYMKLMS